MSCCMMFSKKLTASMIMLAKEEEEEDDDELEPVATDPRKACPVNTAIAIFCAAVIFLVVHVCSLIAVEEEPRFWEALACSAAYFVLCVVPLRGVLMLRRDLVSMYAAAVSPDGGGGGGGGGSSSAHDASKLV